MISLRSLLLKNIQSGASSRAKIGGAYFSDITGSIQDPIAVPGPCEVTECQILMAVFTTSNFSFAPHRHNAPAARLDAPDCSTSPARERSHCLQWRENSS